MPLSDKIVVRVEKTVKGWVVHTQGGRIYGPFPTEYEMGQDQVIGQRAMNWLVAQGGRPAPARITSGENY